MPNSYQTPISNCSHLRKLARLEAWASGSHAGGTPAFPGGEGRGDVRARRRNSRERGPLARMRAGRPRSQAARTGGTSVLAGAISGSAGLWLACGHNFQERGPLARMRVGRPRSQMRTMNADDRSSPLEGNRYTDHPTTTGTFSLLVAGNTSSLSAGWPCPLVAI